MASSNSVAEESDINKKFFRMGMSDEDFQNAAKDMVEYVIKYYNSLNGRQPSPSVKPGFMRKLIPAEAPQQAGEWKDLLADLDDVVMKGLTHWQSSRFFGFFPTATSYPAILADILTDACACVGFTWASSPSCTELETVVLDWLAKAIGLPDCFIHAGVGPGCGVIHGTASEATIMTLLAARTKFIKIYSEKFPELSQHEILSKLMAYTSEYSHSSVERACLIGMVNMTKLSVDENISVRGETLRKAIEADKAKGKIPFFVCATLGTTDCVSFDNLEEIAKECSSEDIWLHVDAAYAGSSFICPEFRHHMKGIEMVTSFNFNPHKWMQVNFDCSALWVRNSSDLINSFKVTPHYLRHEEEDEVIDYRHWQIPLGRRFRSLKLWFVFRLIGIEGIRRKIREDVALAKLFETLVRKDKRFEVLFPVELGLVCFRLVANKEDKAKNKRLNQQLLKQIDDSKDLYLIGSEVKEVSFIRVSTGVIACDEDAIRNCWAVVQKHATTLLQKF